MGARGGNGQGQGQGSGGAVNRTSTAWGARPGQLLKLWREAVSVDSRGSHWVLGAETRGVRGVGMGVGLGWG